MLIASSSKDVKFHTFPEAELHYEYKPTTGANDGLVKTISWGKDGSWLVLVSSKGLVEIIGVREKQRHLHTITSISNPNCSSFQNNTKKNIAVGTITGQVMLYDVKLKKITKEYPRASSSINRIEFLAKDNHFITSCENGDILLYSNTICDISNVYRIPNSKTVSTIRCHPNKRNLIAAGSEEGIVAIWNINSKKTKWFMQAHAAPITDVAFSPIRTDLIVSLGLDRKFSFYDSIANSCCFEFCVERSLTAVDFFPDGVNVCVASQDGNIFIYDTRNMTECQKSFKAHQGPIRQVHFQKEISGDNSSCNLEADEMLELKIESVCNDNNNFDSFGLLGEPVGDVSVESSNMKLSPSSIKDSFLEALGVSNDSIKSLTSIKEKSSVVKIENLQNSLNLKSTQLDITHHCNAPIAMTPMFKTVDNIIIEARGLSKNSSPVNYVKGISSTPKFMEAAQMISPIMPQQQQQPSSSVLRNEDLENIRGIFREELNLMKNELRCEFMEAISQVRMHIMNLKMLEIKHFVMLEEALTGLRSDIATEEGNGSDLLFH